MKFCSENSLAIIHHHVAVSLSDHLINTSGSYDFQPCGCKMLRKTGMKINRKLSINIQTFCSSVSNDDAWQIAQALSTNFHK